MKTSIKPFMTVTEVAYITGFEVDVVLGWITSKKITAMNIDGAWRIRDVDLRRYCERGSNTGPLEWE